MGLQTAHSYKNKIIKIQTLKTICLLSYQGCN